MKILCALAIGNRNGIECAAHIFAGKSIGNLDKSAKELNDVNDMFGAKKKNNSGARDVNFQVSHVHN